MSVIVLKHNNKISGFYDSASAAETFINSCISCNFMKKTDKFELEYYKMNSYELWKTEKPKNKNLIQTTNKQDNKPSNKNKQQNKNNKLSDKAIKINKMLYEEFSESDTTSVNSENINKHDFDINAQILDNDTDSEKSLVIKEDDESDTSFTLDAEAFLQKKREEREHQQKMIEIGQQKIDVLSHINKLKLEKQKMVEKKTKYDYDLSLYEKFKQLKNDDFSFNIPIMFKDKYALFEKLENNNELSFEAFIENYFEAKLETQYEDMFSSEPHAYKLPKPEDFKSDDLNTLMSAAF